MTLKDRVQNLCKNHGVSMNQLEQELDFGRGYLSKLGKTTPNTAKIKAIADYFGVSVDYLLIGETGTPETPASKPVVSDEDIKFALFGGDGDITDEMYREVLSFADYVKQKARMTKKE